ncbi:MAG: hypothetical protein Q9227_007484 [Pyrenula ochraceoflavens]
MTPDVTALYYRIINSHIRQKLGHRHSARLYIYSVDLESQLRRVENGNWSAFANEYIDAVRPLVSASPKPVIDGVLLGAILAHKIAPELEATLNGVPFLHVADFVAAAIKAKDISKVGLLGPGWTMKDDSHTFFKGKLEADHGLSVLVPETQLELDEVNRGMFEEVVKGKDAVTPRTRQMFKEAANRLLVRGAQGLILGSTDLGFVLEQADFEVPVFDAAKIHAQKVAEWALRE